MQTIVIRPRERDSVIQALRAGVVPRVGVRHIQVGRARELAEMIRDIDRITDGGSSFRAIIGAYGSGKTFFESLVRAAAQEKGLVTVNADLSPERRLHATGGEARALYAELIRNMATRSKPEGGALQSVVERFIGLCETAVKESGREIGDAISERLSEIRDLVGGHDLAKVIERYAVSYRTGDENGKGCALRWLRGEYTTKTEARHDLGVRNIIDDDSFYDHLKLMAVLVKQAGYGGLMVLLDELVNLYKLQSSRARESNYEEILRILNDVLQGSARHIGFVLGGTPEFLIDPRRGLYSYQALQSRLAENSFAKGGLIDLSGPVIRLQSLSPEDLFILLKNVRTVFAGGDPDKVAVPDEALEAFMQHCLKRIGEAYFRTPRTTIRSFADLLAILEQNPTASWRELIGQVEVKAEEEPVAVVPGRAADDGPAEPLRKVPAASPALPGLDLPLLTQPVAAAGDDDLSAFRL